MLLSIDQKKRSRVLQPLIEKCPTDGRIYHRLASAHYHSGNWTLAKQNYRKSIRLLTSSVKKLDVRAGKLINARMEFAVGLSNQGDLKGARIQLQECLKIDPQNARVHINLGSLLLHMSKDSSQQLGPNREHCLGSASNQPP